VKNGQQKRGQACKQMKLLFVLRATDLLPICVSLPPTSLKNSKQFFRRLTQNNVLHYGVLAGFSLEGDKNPEGIKYSKVQLTVKGRLRPEETLRFKAIKDQLQPYLDKVAPTPDDYNGARGDTAEA
jgi:hypothetical protein